MTKVIRCDCGFVAREPTIGEVNRAAETHLRQSHPETDLELNEACSLIEGLEDCEGCCC